MLFAPVKEKVSSLEFDTPDIVTVPPVFATEAAESILTNSALPDWMMVSVFGVTPEAENVAEVVRAFLPVCTDADHDMLSSPLPDVLLGIAHDA